LGSSNSNTGGWRSILDGSVWKEYTSDSKYRQHYDCNSVPDLLRFMRNANQHTRPGSAASAIFQSSGGIEHYFLQQFPLLLLVTWEATAKANWGVCKNSEFSTYQPSGTSASCTTGSSSVYMPAFDAQPPKPPRKGVASWSKQQVAEWLAGIGNVYARYSAGFIGNGIDGVELMDGSLADEELVEFGVASAVHRKRILKEIGKLRK
jgi:hypothetical protein